MRRLQPSIPNGRRFPATEPCPAAPAGQALNRPQFYARARRQFKPFGMDAAFVLLKFPAAWLVPAWWEHRVAREALQ